MPHPPKTPSENPKLPDFLCFAVYSANLAFGRVYKPILDQLGLTYTQYIALVALGDEDDQTVGALGEKLFLESNTLTPILKKLETMDLIRRQRDPADERQVRVQLAPSGRRLLERIEKEAGPSLIDATGLGKDFPALRKAVAGLRDNLLRSLEAPK
ncbi:MarR family winged helix-turn-helix transcriptional regulator [Taklimakanibacter deserti]|uniref:MarR family winged helix-turn-helix transcriptional regulator n=1 Tax=Taklimakanibacter deserti TaxID=2267839 RepID=UPI000E64B782